MKRLVPISIGDLEEAAKQEQDGTKNYRLRDRKWLEVMFRHNKFYYYYGVTEISKMEAVKILHDCH